MSDFGKPKSCMNDCGAIIYFDAHSSIGHPTADKWLPLEYKEGRKTDTIHDCPKKRQNGTNTLTAAATDKKSVLSMDNLAMIKVIAAALNEYIAIKEKS